MEIGSVECIFAAGAYGILRPVVSLPHSFVPLVSFNSVRG